MLLDNNKITEFVRNTLGCTCPDEVFKRIEVHDARCEDTLYEQKIIIGGKLLLFLAKVDSPDLLHEQLPLLLSEGKAERDRRGLNRFRAVLTTGDVPAVSEVATGIFNDFPGWDGRIHLHVVDSKAIT